MDINHGPRQSLNFEEIKVTFVPTPTGNRVDVWKAPAGDGYYRYELTN